ncbi:MAG: efflux RND transporter periplasmic adaptor subunit [Magnetococcales bacterium]|nr:efflux RND transporter periplasmic adaptor subunit [Magnetococcales bacterium]
MIFFQWGTLLAAEINHVTTQPLYTLTTAKTLDAPAAVISLNDTQITAEVAGAILKRSLKVGDRVKKGETLLKLDPWEHRFTLDQARASLKELESRRHLAERQYQRALELKKNNQTSTEILDRRKNERSVLDAQISRQKSIVRGVEKRIAKYTIKAPFAGVVVQQNAQLGAWAAPGTPLLRLMDLNEIELTAQVGVTQAEQLLDGEAWHFRHQEQNYPLQPRVVLPVANPTTRTREARLEFIGPTPTPGAAGRLTWQSPKPHLPPWLLVNRDEKLGIFLAEENQARFYPLPQAKEGQSTPLTMDLTGDVIVQGRENLVHGAPIQVAPPSPLPSSP